MTTSEHRTSRVLTDRFDRDVLMHMLLWAPHGALFDEDVFPAFGMSVRQFRRRFVQLVEFYERANLDHADRRLVEGARHYLRYCEPTKRKAEL